MNAGLCDTCQHQRIVRNTRGSAFSLCELSRTDERFPRYPRVPVESCPGHEPRPPVVDDAARGIRPPVQPPGEDLGPTDKDAGERGFYRRGVSRTAPTAAEATGAAPSLDARVMGYSPEPSPFHDEATDAPADVLDAYSVLLERLSRHDLESLRATVQLRVDAMGADFGTAAGRRPFPVDPIPRIVGRDEWATLAAGAAQRVRALNAFIADVYCGREIVDAGILPERALAGGDHFESGMHGLPPAPTVAAPVAGLDVVRDGDGSLLVLEDNLRTPSGLAYLEAARIAADAELPEQTDAMREPLEPAFAALRKALEDARGEIPGEVVILSDGPANSAWFEHRVLAERTALPLVTLDDVYTDGGRVHAWVDGEATPVAALYRRTEVDRLTDAAGKSTHLATMLHGARASGNIAIIDDFGTGIGDDKLIHAYVEDMVRFYLGEEPVIRSVPTFDLARPEALDEVADRIDEMVIKPRTGHGGQGIVVCAHADAHDRARALAAIRARPEEYVAQPMVSISRHPTVIDGKLEPRHVDLRVFVLTSADGEYVVPGGLTRVALNAGALVVNSSQAGGGKDTWVLT